MRKLLIMVLVGVFALGLSAQTKLRVVIPQNVCVESSAVPYGILMDESWRKDSVFPVVHVTLYDAKGQTLLRMQQRPNSEANVSLLQLPSLVKSGSYVLTANILTSDLTQVVEESSAVIHVIGSGRGQYYTLPENIRSDKDSEYAGKMREEVCLDGNSEDKALGFVVSHDVYWEASHMHAIGSASQELQYELSYRVLESQLTAFPALFNTTSRLVHPIAKNGVVKVPEELYNRNVQYIDMENGPAAVMCRFEYPKPLWTSSDLVEVQMEGDRIEVLRRKAEERELINRIFENEILGAPAAQLSGWMTEADDEFDLSNYLAFESLELFFKEVAGAVRVRSKNEDITIRLLNGDSKDWYSDSPVLLIDGVLQSDVDKLWDVPFENCTTVRLYRRLNSIRRTFGPLGRNGVIEIVTKSPNTSLLPVLAGVHPWQAYNMSNLASTPTTGVFRALQCFEPVSTSEFCYTHGDDLGMFIYQQTSLQRTTSTNIAID